MRTDESLANLRRRLGIRPYDDEADEGAPDEPGEPNWIPDGQPGRGHSWLTAIRADPGRAGGTALAVIAALAVLVTIFTLMRQRPAPVVSANLPPVEMVSTAAPSTSAAPPAAAKTMVVSVIGLVAQPGLVTLTPDARVADAVSAAGGPLRGADTIGLNLARRLADGEQIVVGIAAPAGQPPALGSSVGGSDGAAERPPTPSKPAAPVDLNTATAEELDALPGVGPVTAAAIVAWRSANGRFSTVDQLGEIDGIGPARLEKLRPMVRV
jgi:competence protein ComEA